MTTGKFRDQAETGVIAMQYLCWQLLGGFTEIAFGFHPFRLPPAARHPELGLKVVDGGSIFTTESDHIAFIERSVLCLYVHAGSQGDSPRALDALDNVDAEQEVWPLHMIYCLVQDLANSACLPHRTQASRDPQSRFLDR